MALFDRNKLLTMAGLGLGAAILIPAVSRLAGEAGKPMLKGLIKGGMLLAERGKVLLAETLETIDDLTAEAQAEMEDERRQMAAAAFAAADAAPDVAAAEEAPARPKAKKARAPRAGKAKKAKEA